MYRVYAGIFFSSVNLVLASQEQWVWISSETESGDPVQLIVDLRHANIGDDTLWREGHQDNYHAPYVDTLSQ